MKLFAAIAAACLCASALGQGVRYDNRVVTVARNNPPGSQVPMLAVPNAQVTICADGNCASKATIFSNQGLTTQTSNPIRTDGQGNFGFWAAPGNYFYKVVAPSGTVNGIFPFTLGGSGGTDGFPITLGSTSIDSASTTTTIAGLTLTAPTLTAPVLGTPASGVATNLTGLPLTSGVTGILPIANGGTATATPSLVPGTNISITGTWPNQTITASATAATAFSALTSSTNTVAAMVVGTGASLGFTGSGAINASALGGIGLSGLCQTGGTGCPQLAVTKAATTNQWLNSYTSSTGLFTSTRPTFSDLSGNIAVSQINSGTGASSSTFLRGDNTWATPSGSGTVTTSGSPTTNTVSKFCGSTIICNSGLSDDGTALTYAGAGSSHGITVAEGTAIAGVASSDVLYADSTSHRWIQNPNNNGATIIPGIAAAGTAGHLAVLAANGIDIQDGGVVPTGTVTGVTGTSPIVSSGGTAPAISCPTCGVTGSPLSQFAATTSAQLLGVISDETGTGALVFATSPTLVTPVLGVATATSVNGTAIPASVTLTQTIASGTSALGTAAIASGACATVVTTTATGTASTDAISWNPNGSIKAVTGYVPSTSGGLTIAGYPTTNSVNWDVCNWTSASITPGAVTLNWRVTR